MSEEEKSVLETFKKGYGLTEAERKILSNLIEKQQKEIEELKRDYEILSDDMKNHNVVYTDMPEFEERYISKDKIRNKIKKLEDIKKYQDNMGLRYSEVGLFQGKIDILKELLEE